MNQENIYAENVKSWVRPLQRSLTLETEFGFKNILGKEKYFNEFLYESFSNINHLIRSLVANATTSYLIEHSIIIPAYTY